MYKINEKEIGNIAASRLTTSLRGHTSSFADHVNRNSNKESLKNASAIARYKNYGLVKNGNKQIFLRAISIRMERHGFIRNYGVNTTRAAGKRTRRSPYSTSYFYKSHLMKQIAKPFIDSAIENSAVVDFVSLKVAESRGLVIGNEIAVILKDFG